MLQIVDGHPVFVVNLPYQPQLPINADGTPGLEPYAQALNAAFAQGLVTIPGKYGIEVFPDSWIIYNIIE